MSVLGSISTAVTGMTAQSRSLGNISDNLANTSTKGFKSIGTNFRDIVSSDTSEQVGIGTSATPVYYNSLQGSLSFTSVDTNLAVSGKGFFTVTPGSTASANTGSLYYTRCGDFSLDKDGYLANSDGYYLMGWNVDTATGLASTGSVVPVGFSDFIDEGVTTTASSYEANLPATVDIGATTSDSTTTIYDSKGYGHDIAYAWEKTGVNTWDLTITAPGGAYDAATDTAHDYTATATFVFDASGPHTIIDSTGASVVVDNTGHIASITSPDVPVTGTSLALSLTYKDQDPLVTTPTALQQTVASEFDKLTQFAGTSIDFLSFSQNGTATGTFENLSIDGDGHAALNYSNGISRTYFQIPLALFNAPEQLQRMSGGLFQASLGSGTVTYNAAETNGAGKLAVGALENSTVDIADQFTRMIQAQRAYSANAKTVSTADSMLETLVTI